VSTRAEEAERHYSQASALQNGETLRPEAVARQLFSRAGLSQRRVRGATATTIEGLRRAYLRGVKDHHVAYEHLYYDERLTIHVPTTASSYDDRQLKAWVWGWEDDTNGRFG
jgi:hypothetical protein